MKFIIFVLLSICSCSLLAQDSSKKKISTEMIQSQFDSLTVMRASLLRHLHRMDVQLDSLSRLIREHESKQQLKDGIFVELVIPAKLLETPSVSAKEIQSVPAKLKLRALGYEGSYWQVEYNGIIGYIPSPFVKTNRTAQNYFEQTSKVKSNARASNGNSSIGNTNRKLTQEKSTAVQCSATTKKGSRCKLRTKNFNGRCWRHQ